MRGIASFTLLATLGLTGADRVYGEPVAPQSIDAVIAALTAVTDYQEAVISPDGRVIAWAEGVPEASNTSTRSAVWFLSLIHI